MDRFRSPRAVSVPPRRSSRRLALTLLEVVIVVAIVLVLITFVLVALPFLHKTDRFEARCPSNLRSIGVGLYTYATENNDMWPIAAHASAEADEVGRVTYAPKMIGAHRGKQGDPKAGETTADHTEMSTTRNLWALVRTAGCPPKVFICPSSRTDQPNDEDNPADYWDFREWKEVSYGYQVPYGKHGLPSNNCDQRMPLVADKGPYGAALETGAKNPGVPTPGPNAAPADWMPWNSPNHAGEGQVVLFADTHAEFLQRPICGVKNDNIYTRWSSATGGSETDPTPRIHGTLPTGIETPWGDTDSFIYP